MVEIHGERVPSAPHALEIMDDVSPGGNKMGKDKSPPPPYGRSPVPHLVGGIQAMSTIFLCRGNYNYNYKLTRKVCHSHQSMRFSWSLDHLDINGENQD